jgi:hypothetical protein
LFCHQFYENILVQNTEHDELLILCYLLLEKEVNCMMSAAYSSFLDEKSSFIGKFLISYTKKIELKTYLNVILGNLILKIESSTESCVDLDLTKISNYINNKKPNQVVNKSYSAEVSKSILGVDNENLTKQIQKSKILRHRGSIKSTQPVEGKMITYTLEGISINSNIKLSKGQITSFNSSNNTNEFYLELIESIDNIKFDENSEYNTDYATEMTQEELSIRLLNESDENMKEFCKLFLKISYQAIREINQA